MMERATLTDYLKDCIENVKQSRNGFFGMRVDALQDAVNQLSDPDRVKVVRCRDCVEWEAPTKAEQREGETFGYCRCRFGTGYGQQTDMNWFCADGGREE